MSDVTHSMLDEAAADDEPTLRSVRHVLILAAVSQLAYPITESGSLLGNWLWELTVLGLMIAGIQLVPRQTWIRRAIIAITAIWALVTVVYSFNQTAVGILIVGYLAYLAVYLLMVKVMLHVIFTAQEVDREVLFAASAAYLLIGGAYTTMFGMVETLTFLQTGGGHAFTGAALQSGVLIPWQDFVYFSYVTLTSLGYGDMSPATMTARALAISEAVIGVLYVTIIMARLVSLYVTREQGYSKS